MDTQQPSVDALLRHAEARALVVELSDYENHPRSRVSLSLAAGEHESCARSASVVTILSTGEMVIIAFDGSYSFVRFVDIEDEEDVDENADEFVGLAAAYLHGDGEVTRVSGFLGIPHTALVIGLGPYQYEIGDCVMKVRNR